MQDMDKVYRSYYRVHILVEVGYHEFCDFFRTCTIDSHHLKLPIGKYQLLYWIVAACSYVFVSWVIRVDSPELEPNCVSEENHHM